MSMRGLSNNSSNNSNSNSSNNTSSGNNNNNSEIMTTSSGSADNSPSWAPKTSLFPFSVNIKTAILAAICMQNAGYTLLRKYSVQTENVSSKEILILSELIKLFVSVWFVLNSDEASDAAGHGLDKLKWLIDHSGKMFVLAAIYGTMNILSFVALQYIGAGEFTICAQLKVLTTAGFSVLILKTSLSWKKWRALVLLAVGCGAVAYATNQPSPAQSSVQQSSGVGYFQLLGYGAVLLEVCLSGFASIYFEKVVKSKTETVTIWERNFQLSVYSILLYLGIIFYDSFLASVDESSPSNRTAWSNWSLLTVVVSVLGAAGGLLVAATLKYADSILKTLATAGAIIISTVLGHYLLNGPLNFGVVLGAVLAIYAIWGYTFDTTPSVVVSPVASRDVEKQ